MDDDLYFRQSKLEAFFVANNWRWVSKMSQISKVIFFNCLSIYILSCNICMYVRVYVCLIE